MKVIYKIELELDYRAQNNPALPAPGPTDTKVADLVRRALYDSTDRYWEQIHCTVTREDHPDE